MIDPTETDLRALIDSLRRFIKAMVSGSVEHGAFGRGFRGEYTPHPEMALDGLARDIKKLTAARASDAAAHAAENQRTGEQMTALTNWTEELRKQWLDRAEKAEAACDSLKAEHAALVDDIVRNVAELPDRTSPDDWPEAMLVTASELRSILRAALSSSQAPQEKPEKENR